jgi:predicted nucleic acid-binding protein
MNVVVDSSVVISAIKPKEVHHTQSVAFFEQLHHRADVVWVPMTLLWEIGTSLDHPGKNPSGIQFNRLFDLELQFITIDEGLFQRTWKADLRMPVKAADRIFLSCALDKKALLISWDSNMVKHAEEAGVNGATPQEYVDRVRGE